MLKKMSDTEAEALAAWMEDNEILTEKLQESHAWWQQIASDGADVRYSVDEKKLLEVFPRLRSALSRAGGVICRHQ
jgi:hypothetical protein